MKEMEMETVKSHQKDNFPPVLKSAFKTQFYSQR